MPMTESGRKVMTTMMKKYGAKKGKQVFYASENKGIPGSEKWTHEARKKAMKKRMSK